MAAFSMEPQVHNLESPPVPKKHLGVPLLSGGMAAAFSMSASSERSLSDLSNGQAAKYFQSACLRCNSLCQALRACPTPFSNASSAVWLRPFSLEVALFANDYTGRPADLSLVVAVHVCIQRGRECVRNSVGDSAIQHCGMSLIWQR